MKTYDVVILGAGPGGYVAAVRAAQLGATTAIIEKDSFGGTCLNVGCAPTKILIKNAEIINSVKKATERGITVSNLKLDISEAINYKDQVIDQLTQGVEGLIKSNKIDVYKGTGNVTKTNTVIIDGEEEIGFKKLIIATGSSPIIPPIAGIDCGGILTNAELLSLKEIPKHLLIVGGGVIGCEFATIFRAFGSEVTIVEMQKSLVPNMDKDISKMLGRNLKDKGVCIKTGHTVNKISRSNDDYQVEITKGDKSEIIEPDKILVSVGRKPNLLGLYALDLTIEGMFIKVNDYLETNIKNIYAIGDVTGKMQLAHVASAMGIRVVENCFIEKKPMDLSIVPNCIYTLPEIGAVGLTEMQAKEKYDEIIVGRFPLIASAKAFAMGDVEGMFKVIADKKTKKVVGAHLFGSNATEIIAELAAYMKMGATIDDIGETIHAHPTISECVMEAAHDAAGHCIHLPKR